jgi:hypothetical protein
MTVSERKSKEIEQATIDQAQAQLWYEMLKQTDSIKIWRHYEQKNCTKWGFRKKICLQPNW